MNIKDGIKFGIGFMTGKLVLGILGDVALCAILTKVPQNVYDYILEGVTKGSYEHITKITRRKTSNPHTL